MRIKKKKCKLIQIIFILSLLCAGQAMAQVSTGLLSVEEEAVVVDESVQSEIILESDIDADTDTESESESDAKEDTEMELESVIADDNDTKQVNTLKQKIEASPSVIDEQFLKSEIGKYSIKLKNNTDRKLDIYAMVNNVSATDGKLEFNTVSSEEKAVSAANWILIKRGVIEIMPLEEISVPLEIRVSQNAVPGKYYVAVSFPTGPHRAGAQANMLNNSFAETRINIAIGDNAIEKAQIKKFIASRNLFLNKEVALEFGVENLGNRTIDPYGFIYITNRKGAEVAQIEILEGENNLGPGQISDFTKKWSNGVSLGKYKAKLELEYGQKNTRDLQDTLFFWVLPWQSLLFFVLLALVLVVLLTFIIFKKTYRGSVGSKEKEKI